MNHSTMMNQPPVTMTTQDGEVIVAGMITIGDLANPAYLTWMARLNVNGAPDTEFGNQGEAMPACGPINQCSYQSVIVQPDGKKFDL